MNSLTRALSRLRHADDGVSLVEVMVSITVLVVAMSAVASTTIASLQTAANSRESIIGANVAQFELERLRSIPFVDWVVTARSTGGNSTTTTNRVSLDSGQVYDITREAVWVAAGSTTDGCETALSGQGNGTDYVRVTQTIAFPDRSVAPVTNTTIITPRLDFYDPDTGNLAVQVRDRNGVGSAGHIVQITGLAGTEVGTTDSNGCVFFPFLTVDSSNPANNGYDLTISTPGHIDLGTLQEVIDQEIFVQAQQTAVIEYFYPEFASFDVTPDLPAAPLYAVAGDRRPADNCAITEVVGRLRCLDSGGAAVPTLYDGSSWSAAIPEDLAVSLVNGNIGHTVFPSDTPDADQSVDVRPTRITPLYPFAAGYNAFTGRCIPSDPSQTGAGGTQLLASEPGADTAEGIEMALVTIYTGDKVADADEIGPPAVPGDRDGDGSTVDQRLVSVGERDVWAETQDDTNCGLGDRMYLGRSDANGRLTTVMPFGTWYLYSRSNLAGAVVPPLVPGPSSCTQPPGTAPSAPTASCFQIRADYQVVQTAEGVSCSPPPTDTSIHVSAGDLTLTTACGTSTGRQLGYVFTVANV